VRANCVATGYAASVTSSTFRRDAGLSALAALAAGAYLFAYKRAGAFADPPVLAYGLLIVAAILNSGLAVAEGGRAAPYGRRPVRLAWSVSGLLALFTISGNWCSAEAIALLEPPVTSVLLRTEIVFVGIFGVLLLGERMKAELIVGATTALLGLCVMRWPLHFDGSLLGAAWGLGAAASFALMQVTTRRVIHRISPVFVNAARLWIAVLLFSFQPGLFTKLYTLPWAFWPLIGVAALLGPFVGRLCIMYSLRTLTAAHSALLLLLSPLFAALIGLFLDAPPPTAQELLGGAVMLAGIAWPSFKALRRAG
jgi:drug/metabolite transporter (DMT)-like permease